MMPENIKRTEYIVNLRGRIENLTSLEKLLLSVMFAGLTGIAAHVKIYLPFTPVPITLQTLVVMLSGIIIGYYGALSQVIYALLGILGVPWFAYGGGTSYIVSPTFGYILGFIAASTFLAETISRRPNISFVGIISVLVLANAIIYFCGVTWLYAYLNVVSKATIWDAMLLGVIPFVPGDVIKILIAASVARLLRK